MRPDEARDIDALARSRNGHGTPGATLGAIVLCVVIWAALGFAVWVVFHA